MLRSVNRGVKSNTYILPAPIGGLNSKDAISSMGSQYAIKLDNYIPLENCLVLRSGFSEHCIFGDEKAGVKTLVSYNKPNNERMIAIYNGGAYNVTGTIGYTKYEDVSFANNECQTVQYKNYLYFLNGTDTPKVFHVDDEGVDHFEDWGFTSESLQAGRIISGSVSKEFLWFVEKNTLKAWFSSVAGNTSGELKAFDLSQVAKLGGELIAVANWTIDGGQGIDDLTVFITSEGEALVYSGSNPNSADDWSLKGSYNISRPIGYKCVLKYQGDIVIISEDGYIPLSKALSLSNSGQSTYAFSDLIRGTVLDRTSNNKDRFGWQGIIYNKKGYAIFNVPVSQQFEQHVINVNTGAWCRFTGIRSFCWCEFNGEMYFGADNGVYLFGESYSDNGIQIEGEIQQAYTNLGTDKLKKIQLLNPRTKSSTQYQLTVYTNMDFEDQKREYYSNIGTIGQTKWNKAKWSSSANPIGTKWSTLKTTKIRSQWIATNSTGFKASVVFKTKTKGNVIEWYDTGIRYEVGSGIM